MFSPQINGCSNFFLVETQYSSWSPQICSWSSWKLCYSVPIYSWLVLYILAVHIKIIVDLLWKNTFVVAHLTKFTSSPRCVRYVRTFPCTVWPPRLCACSPLNRSWSLLAKTVGLRTRREPLELMYISSCCKLGACSPIGSFYAQGKNEIILTILSSTHITHI